MYGRDLRAVADQLEAALAEVARLYTLAIEQGERAILAEGERDALHLELQAARREVEQLTKGFSEAHRRVIQMANDAAMERDHDRRRVAELDAITTEVFALRREVDRWREARRAAMEAGEILKAERDALRAEVERLREVSSQLDHALRGLTIERDVARAEVERLWPIIEVARRQCLHPELTAAVDAYLAAPGVAGKGAVQGADPGKEDG